MVSGGRRRGEGEGSVRKNATSRGAPLPCNNFRRKIHDNRDHCRRLCEFRMQVCLRHSFSRPPPFFSPKPSSPPFILPSSSFFFLLPTRSLLRPASCQPLVSFSLPLADRAPPFSWISPSLPFSPRRRPQETTSKRG